MESIHFRGHDYELVESKIVEMKEPNRFDSLAALDRILRTINEIGEHTVGFADDTDAIRKEVYALRAYITGREQ